MVYLLKKVRRHPLNLCYEMERIKNVFLFFERRREKSKTKKAEIAELKLQIK